MKQLHLITVMMLMTVQIIYIITKDINLRFTSSVYSLEWSRLKLVRTKAHLAYPLNMICHTLGHDLAHFEKNLTH